ncbi:glycerophosphoryl diester phosphodiesterase [Actinoplanes octamycinicus]|uniref:Glycerophosphoryl diester phosphodiesterase n=1 Tax=Actinoplanes octamycinicus TaxID=135948 RepID=A0A7W7MAK3_9ACTN|nr:glycerophosphodiester phosphodiesterase family protein [Actinoplanes octamycinicus]MBB4743087.1 glycerophosphoryl diester phosphodiesterase [Actinoplanes octamycinicus]GIE61351.1 putative glycerophosphoryl diester phosphodiesterase precursor (GlpQ) [Actinoplanes octamycinicus]
MILRTAVLVAVLVAGGTAQPAAAADQVAGHPARAGFDLQAHRGGLGLTTEESLEGFAKALRLGVSTLELDTHVTKDEKVVVNHDRQVSAVKCRDTAPVTPGDTLFPYVGKYLKDLTLAQLKTLDCGYRQLPGFPEQEVVAGFRMVELKDVFALVRRYRASGVTLNIETKVEAGAPEQTQPRELFVRRVYQEIRASGLERQVTVQSFDWGALMLMHRFAPRWPLVALTNYDSLQVGKPGASPWLGGLDADDFGGDFVRVAAAVPGVRALSPVYGFPQNGTVGDPDFRFYVSPAMVRDAHARGLEVIPWTCDDPATIGALMDMGIDGIITDYPDRVRRIMAERGMRLPRSYGPRPRR